MQRLGYVVAKFANDGFALLRGDRMLPKPGSGVVGKTAVQTSSSSNNDRNSNLSEETVRPQEGSLELAGAPTADIVLSSNDLRGPPEDEDLDP